MHCSGVHQNSGLRYKCMRLLHFVAPSFQDSLLIQRQDDKLAMTWENQYAAAHQTGEGYEGISKEFDRRHSQFYSVHWSGKLQKESKDSVLNCII